MKYTVYVTLFGSSAQNAGIVSSKALVRSKWTDKGLEYEPLNDPFKQSGPFEIEAWTDGEAFDKLTVLFGVDHPRDKRPISGKSYIRFCRASRR